MRIAVVQFEIAHQAPEKNWERIEQFIQKAVTQTAEVIIFPEDCITGSLFGDITKLDTTETTKQSFQRLALQYKIDIVTGSVMTGTAQGNFNTSYYIDATGTVLGTYSKNHLYPSEYAFLTPGSTAPVFETRFGKAAIVICWDLLFSELFQRLVRDGVEIIYCPSYWYREIAETMATYNTESEEEQIDALCRVRALETNCLLVYANAAGIMTYKNGSKDTLIGHSQLVLPQIGAQKKLSHRNEELFVETVDLSLLKKTNAIYQLREPS
ncbi:carbon-nitrogen hydrolase family protein [Patescibacteria group bacterium]|nr:carbon-nitrogen hydrolase family protein [Patescibacteria group bacterium]